MLDASSSRILFLTCTAAFAASPCAQRPEPTLEWQKRTTTITYGQVPLGKHTLDELAVGKEWRLGNNEASTWSLQMPILAGDTVLAPGEYRVSMLRTDATHCEIVAHGSRHATGASGDARVAGQLGVTGKPSKKLVIEWGKAAGAAAANQAAQLVVQFGENEWKGDVTLAGGKAAALPGWKLVVFTLPAAAVDARDKAPVPVATLSRGTGKTAENWNLVLGKEEARLVPWMSAPTESYGFGETKAPESGSITTGKVAASDAPAGNGADLLDLEASSLQKDELVLQLRAGKQLLTVTVPEPKRKPAR